METKILHWENTKDAVALLKQGEAVAFPTETVYGMGVIASSKEAFDRLVSLKRRPADKPFTLMVSNYTDIARFAEVDAAIIRLIHIFMPGEVTFLLKARKDLPYQMDLGTGILGVRFPAHAEVSALIEAVDEPLLVPSANRSGQPPLQNAASVKQEFDGELPAVIDGPVGDGLPSTIVDLSKPHQIHLIREGRVPFVLIEKAFLESRSTEIAVASDHGGFLLKEKAKAHLSGMGFSCYDAGTHSSASCDYPLFAADAAKRVASGASELGLLFCTSGEGVAIAANKIKGIRCGIGYDDVAAGKTREHNGANMIAFGAKYMEEEDVLRRIDIFLTEMPSKLEKHHRRIDQIAALE